MKALACAFLLPAALNLASAQEPWRQVLAVDPLRANGYFIIDQQKAASLRLASLDVDIVADRQLPNDSIAHRTVESFTIADAHFGRLSLQALGGLAADETWHYELRGFDANGLPVVDVSAIRDGAAWREACRTTCVADQYAWAIVGYSDGAQTYMEINNAVDPGTDSYYYFFVPSAQWNDFKGSHPPAAFGLEYDWYWYEAANGDDSESTQDEVLYVPSIAPGSPAVNGYALGGNYIGQPGWAIRKDRGPWRELLQWTGNYTQPSEVCNVLVQRYNADPLVIGARQAHSPVIPEVMCHGTVVFGDGLGWGEPGPYNPCWDEEIGNYTDPNTGETDVFGWMSSALDCIHEAQATLGPVGDPHVLDVTALHDNGLKPVFNLVLPSGKDPKLKPMPRTELPPGLYVFTVTLEGGSIYRRYEHFTSSVILRPSFAAFSDVSIYPVPVVGRDFAIDFDLDYPLNIGVTVVDNKGIPYYQKQLAFNLAGRNKHVVHMDGPWPPGLYHAVFQYDDGSSESLSFTIAEK